MLERRLEKLQDELDAANAARLERIQQGANTAGVPFSARSFASRNAGLKQPEDMPAPAPAIVPANNVLEDLQRQIAALTVRVEEMQDEEVWQRVDLPKPPWESYLSFGWYRVDDTHIKVRDGRVYPNTDYATAYQVSAETTIELTGSTPSVFVAFEYATNAVTVDTGSAFGGSSPWHFRVLLYNFELLSTGSYALTETRHTGDVYLHWPRYDAATAGALQYWDAGWKNWQVLAPPGTDCLLRNNAGTLSWVTRADYLNP
jgi:hypothetical protein